MRLGTEVDVLARRGPVEGRIGSAGQALFLLAWAAIGVADSLEDGAFSVPSLVWVSASAIVMVLALLNRTEWPGTVPAAAAVCMATACYQAMWLPAEIYGSGVPLTVSRQLWLAAGGAALALMLMGHRRPAPLFCFVIVGSVAVAADLVGIEASRRPQIDVWFMYQTAAGALAHGHNFYLTHWTSGIAGEVSNRFVYLPLSAVVLAPFRWLFGDVRFGLVALSVVCAYAVYRLVGDELRWALASLVLIFPKSTFAIEQSWNDVGLTALVAVTVLAVRRGRMGWAVTALAVAMAYKQYAWLALPAAAGWKPFGWRRAAAAMTGGAVLCLPWALSAPRAFWEGVISYNLHLLARPDSLSWYSFLLWNGRTPGYALIVAGTAAGLSLGLAGQREYRLGFAGAVAMTLVGFDLAGKQTFFNEWELLAGLLVLAVAESRTQSESLSPASAARAVTTASKILAVSLSMWRRAARRKTAPTMVNGMSMEKATR